MKKILGVLGAAVACVAFLGGPAVAATSEGVVWKGPYRTLEECNEVRDKYSAYGPGPCYDHSDPGEPRAYMFSYWV